MKLKLFLIATFFVLVALASRAQERARVRFTNTTQFGVVNGGAGGELVLQTINGISYKTFSIGGGIGIDYYYRRSVPVFIDLRKNLFNRKQSPFVYADLGTNFAWIKNTAQEFNEPSTYSGGFYFDAGAGYTLPLKKMASLVFSAGYSEKKLTEKSPFYYYEPWWGTPANTNSFSITNYTFRRLSVKAGLRF